MRGPYFLFKMKAAAGDAHAFTRRSRGMFGGEEAAWPCAESWERCDVFDMSEVREMLAVIPGASFEEKRMPNGRIVGIVARAEDGGENTLFGALLKVARLSGLSIAVPEHGLLLGTPEAPEERAEAWMQLRKKMLLEQFQAAGSLDYFPLWKSETEWCFIVFCSSWGQGGSARELCNQARSARYPDEQLECHVGWFSIVGPGEAYRFLFNWEVRGNHAMWIPDFREPDCPMVLSHRAAYRMALRAPQERSLVEVGLFHPTVVECIPGPLDRFVSLRLANHRLTERVPREVVEALKAAKAATKESAR